MNIMNKMDNMSKMSNMDKIQRLKAVIKNEVPDVTPAGFWFHYSPSLSPVEMAAKHLELFYETDMDVIKVMQDYPYPLEGQVKNAADWKRIKLRSKKSPEFRKLEEVLKRVLDRAGGEAMVFQTMFSPFKAAVMSFGDDLVMQHARENPEAVAAGVDAIADTLAEWAAGYLDTGASGIYYSAQFGEAGRFTEEVWADLVQPSDIKILKVADQRENRYNILHICGEPEYNFQVSLNRFMHYPADMVNWSVKDNQYTLNQGYELFQKPVLGGLNNKGNILNGTNESIVSEVHCIIESFGSRGLMIGADCTIQGENISMDRIRTAVEAAHNASLISRTGCVRQ